MDDTLWVFGGVKEEDFYTDVYNTEDYQSTEKVLEYYDYFVEETGNGRSFFCGGSLLTNDHHSSL